MKKIFLIMLLLISVTANAQKDVTKFLGIPVDGSKSEMKSKLLAKGFTYNSQYDYFEGEFNGYNVHVFVVTNNNKVYRIMVADANTCSEGNIKIRFNNLCRQFSKNQKYVAENLGESDYTIPDSEKISYEMLINNKRYQAAYFQIPDPELTDTLAIQKMLSDALLKEYTQEQISNPTEKQEEEIQLIIGKVAFDLMKKKSVWFMINSDKYDRYYITMFYDNEYNHADGEDL